MINKMKLLQAITVTSELTGANLSEAAIEVMIADLSTYPAPAVLAALDRCRRELKGRLTLHEIISRIDDGRPGIEEAWAMIPRDEYKSVVWTNEMAEAWGIAAPLLESGDEIAARMAFKEAYGRIVSEAKAAGRAPRWSASLGYDKEGREPALFAAVQRGRITASQACALLPSPASSKRILALMPPDERKLLPALVKPDPAPVTKGSPEVAKRSIEGLNALLKRMGTK